MKMADRIKQAVRRFQQISLSSLFVILVSVIVMITSVVSLLIFVNLYRNDMETLNEIHRCREIKESLDWIESYPAYEKTRSTFYWNMKDVLEKIGYHN